MKPGSIMRGAKTAAVMRKVAFGRRRSCAGQRIARAAALYGVTKNSGESEDDENDDTSDAETVKVICPSGQFCGNLVQPSAEKFFALLILEIGSMVHLSRLGTRGGSRSSRNARRDAMDALVSPDERSRGGRRSRVVLASRR